MKVCHLTSVHPPRDIRIFYKECVSLSKAGYDVTLVCPGSQGQWIEEGVKGVEVPFIQTGRINRMLFFTRKIVEEGLKWNADLYHLHDPELIRWIPLLRKLGKKVIYDAHEDLPLQVMSKYWLPFPVRSLVAKSASFALRHYVAKAHAVVTATDQIAKYFATIHTHVVRVKNYPLMDEFGKAVNHGIRQKKVCYIGSVTKARGIIENVRAARQAGVILLLAGAYSPPSLRDELSRMEEWKGVEEAGFLRRDEVVRVMGQCMAGLVTLHGYQSYKESLPIKMFEYMAAGLPVIASRFPLWKNIIENNHCGICVDPDSIEEIASAIRYLAENPLKAEDMGSNGRRAFIHQYNWEAEFPGLLRLYQHMSDTNKSPR